MVSGHHSVDSARRIVSSRLTGQRNDGVSPVFSRQALMLLPQAPGSQRLVLLPQAPFVAKPLCVRVFFVGSNSPTHLDSPSRGGSRRRHSLSTHLNSHRGLLPVSHVFADPSRLFCFLLAPPGHRCVCLPSARSVVYLFCQADLFVLSWHSTILRVCSVRSTTRSMSFSCHPRMTLTCTASFALHSGLCAFDDLSLTIN